MPPGDARRRRRAAAIIIATGILMLLAPVLALGAIEVVSPEPIPGPLFGIMLFFSLLGVGVIALGRAARRPNFWAPKPPTATPQPSTASGGGRDLSMLSDAQLLAVLQAFTHAAMTNDWPKIQALMPTVKAIGQLLHDRGGMQEMLRLHSQIGPGARAVEMQWDLIGDWRG